MSEWLDNVENEGSWLRLKVAIRSRWAALTDDELEKAKGDWQQLIGTIQQKTGEAANVIADQLEDAAA